MHIESSVVPHPSSILWNTLTITQNRPSHRFYASSTARPVSCRTIHIPSSSQACWTGIIRYIITGQGRLTLQTAPRHANELAPICRKRGREGLIQEAKTIKKDATHQRHESGHERNREYLGGPRLLERT